MKSSAHAPRACFISSFVTGLTLLSAAALVGCAPQYSDILPDDSESEAVADGPRDSRGFDGTDDSNRDSGRIETPDVVPFPDASDPTGVLAKYAYLDPSRMVPRNLLRAALTYFDENPGKLANKSYISILDFSMPSTHQRLFVIDMTTGTVWPTTVAHGKGSDSDHDALAEKFSNVNGSNASSVGVYITAETYSGSHGLSLRLDGMSSTNSKARSRAVVMHGASYVQDRDVRQGRSWGCPAIPMAYRDRMIGMIKNVEGYISKPRHQQWCKKRLFEIKQILPTEIGEKLDDLAHAVMIST